MTRNEVVTHTDSEKYILREGKWICEASALQGYEDLQRWAAKISELFLSEKGRITGDKEG